MNKHGNSKWGILIMVLCVAAPLAAMAVYMLSSAGVIKVSGIWPIALALLCPLSHVIMIPLMHKTMNGSDGKNDNKPGCH